jgi:hypothetical protein
MDRDDWFATPFNTNVGEAGHRIANLHGTQLTLLAAVEAGEKIDCGMFERIGIISTTGTSSRYTSQSAMVRFSAITLRCEQRREARERKDRAAAAVIAEDEHQEQLRDEFLQIGARDHQDEDTQNETDSVVSRKSPL